MTLRTLEKLLILTVAGYVVVLFLYNVAQNAALLDLSVPVMVGVLLVLWVVFGRPEHQQ
jgi:hypothetical protein